MRLWIEARRFAARRLAEEPQIGIVLLDGGAQLVAADDVEFDRLVAQCGGGLQQRERAFAQRDGAEKQDDERIIGVEARGIAPRHARPLGAIHQRNDAELLARNALGDKTIAAPGGVDEDHIRGLAFVAPAAPIVLGGRIRRSASFALAGTFALALGQRRNQPRFLRAAVDLVQNGGEAAAARSAQRPRRRIAVAERDAAVGTPRAFAAAARRRSGRSGDCRRRSWTNSRLLARAGRRCATKWTGPYRRERAPPRAPPHNGRRDAGSRRAARGSTADPAAARYR